MKYWLMHKTHPVVLLEIDPITAGILQAEKPVSPERLPWGVQVCEDGLPNREQLYEWWRGRSIPASRAGLTAALQTLGVSYPEQLIVKCFGLSLSDQYWINPAEHSLKWDKVNFFTNSFSDDVGEILFSGKASGKAINFLSPCNTSDGWLRKIRQMQSLSHPAQQTIGLVKNRLRLA